MKPEYESGPYIVAITGASGMIYASRLVELLDSHGISPHIVITSTAKEIIKRELPSERAILLLEDARFMRYDPDDFSAVIASGSYHTSGMVIVPASMGTIGRIASGTSDNLAIRAADVHLKERRKLIVVPRETPLNRIHLENLLRLNDAGAVILPAMPSFYSKPDSIDAIADTVVIRILDHLGINLDSNVRYQVDE